MNQNSSSSSTPKTLWDKVVYVLELASEQRHIVALRDGMIAAVPVILVGSTFLLFGVQEGNLKELNLADTAFGLWYKSAAETILIPFRYTMGLLSLYVSFTIAAALAKQYNKPEIPYGLTSMATFLMAGELLKGAIYIKGKPFDPETAEIQRFIPAGPLGPEGLFLAIIVGLLTVEISRHLTFMPKSEESTRGVPPAVVNAFATFLPMLACVFLMWGIRHGIGTDVYAIVRAATKPLKEMGDTFGAVFGVNILLHLFGVAGVHGISVINAGMLPIWQEFLGANATAHEMGEPLKYVTAYPFYQWFIWIGGAGATLAPTLRCIRSKNAHVRKIGKVALVPGLFNINEPLIFGLPVVANPILGIPFVVAPLVCGTIAYYATYFGLVGKAFVEVPWVMPCFLGAFMSTNDIRAVILLLVNLTVSYIIWAPFITTYEHRLAMDAEAEGETAPAEPN